MNEQLSFKNGDPVTVTEHRSAHLKEHYLSFPHPSGLRIYLFPKNLSTTYALYATRFGSADSDFTVNGEPLSLPEGCAHFLEHKMFEEADGSDAFSFFSARGADSNAYTTWDKTAYLFSATDHEAECLAALIRFVSDPHFTEASVKKEQGIIAEEIRMNDDSPYDCCYQNMFRALYQKNSIRNEICGSEESIGRITPALLYRCHTLFYRPSNMVLVVAGRLSLREVIDAVDSAYGSERAPDSAQEVTRHDQNENEPKGAYLPRIEVQMQVGKPMFVIGIKDSDAVSLPASERMRRDALMALLKEIYFSTSSELYNRMFDEGLISPDFSAAYGATPLYAFFEITGESDDPDRVLAEILRELSDAKQNGIDPEAFRRAKRVLYAKAVKSFDSTQSIGEMLLDYVLSDYDLFRYVNLFDELTLSDAEALLRSAFSKGSFTISIVSPLDGDA